MKCTVNEALLLWRCFHNREYFHHVHPHVTRHHSFIWKANCRTRRWWTSLTTPCQIWSCWSCIKIHQDRRALFFVRHEMNLILPRLWKQIKFMLWLMDSPRIFASNLRHSWQLPYMALGLRLPSRATVHRLWVGLALLHLTKAGKSSS